MQADLELHRPIRKSSSQFGEIIQTALQQFVSRPIAALITLLVLAIVLAMPLGFFWLLTNAPNALQSLEHSPKVVLYLKTDVTTLQAEALLKLIAKRNDIAKAIYISPEQGLQDLVKQAKIDMTEQLPNNPLPGVIEVLPKGVPSPMQIAQIQADFKKFSEVEQTSFSKTAMEQRYQGLQFAWQWFDFFAGLFAVIAVVIIANKLQFGFKGSYGALFINGVFWGAAVGLLTWLLFKLESAQIADFFHSILVQTTDLDGSFFGKFLLLSIGVGLLGAVLASALLLIHPVESTKQNPEKYPCDRDICA